MRYRSKIYVFTQTARYLLAVLLMLFPATILASSVNTIDTVCVSKSLGDVVNRVISETESSITLGTGTIFRDGNCIRNNQSVSDRVSVPIICPSKGTNDATHPHAVAEVENDSCLVGSDDQYIEYNAYGKVSSIEEGDYATEFTYGPDRERWKTLTYRNDTLLRTVIYAGDYERVTENGVTRHFYDQSGTVLK